MRPKIVPELICSNLQRSLDFYCELLEFKVLYSRPDENFAYLERDDAELMLEQPHRKERLWPRAELIYPYGRGMNLEIHVEDANHLHTSVSRLGLEMILPLEEKWYRRGSDELNVRQFALQDPDGYLIRISQLLGTRPLRN